MVVCHGYHTSAVAVMSFPFETDKLRHQLQQKITVLWSVTPCGLVFKYRRFVEICYFQFHALKMKVTVFFQTVGWSGQSPSKLRHIHQTTRRHDPEAVPLQAWSGPEGSRKSRFPDFVTTAQDDGKVVSLRHRPPLPPGNAPGTHFC